MKCQDFEALIIDLVRETAGDGTLNARAMEHARSCRRCTQRLEDEHLMTKALRLAAEDPAEPPCHLETEVLSAFRQRQENLPHHSLTGFRKRRFWNPAWGIAAALVITLLGAVMFRILVSSQPAAQPLAGLETAASPGQEATRAVEPPAASSGVPESSTNERAETATLAAAQSAGGAKPQAPRPSAEISTDFIALTSGAEIASMESGQLVRVLLPRSAVAAYGLPYSRELADRPVAAQVLIGQDGMARAIRFLGEPDSGLVQTSLSTAK